MPRSTRLLCSGLLFLLMLGLPHEASAAVILAIDVGGGPVQAGFESFPVEVGLESGVSTGAPVTHTYTNGIAVTISATDADHSWQTRIRNPVPEAGTFTQSDLMRDLMGSSDGFAISALIEGLTPGNSYDVEVWSFDQVTPLALSDWTANGSLILQNYSYFQGYPTSNEDCRIVFNIAADLSGAIEIIGSPTNPTDGVRINGLRISGELNAVPEPSSMLLLGLGSLGLIAIRRRSAMRNGRGI